jgi:hypothetical protein
LLSKGVGAGLGNGLDAHGAREAVAEARRLERDGRRDLNDPTCAAAAHSGGTTP